MTERTVEDAEKDMTEVYARLRDRRFIYGPVWNAVAVTFDVEHETDCSEEQREKNFNNYLDGKEKGVVTPSVQSLDGMDTEVTLTNGMMKKIHEVSMDILRNEAEELRKLRAEKRYLLTTGPNPLHRFMEQYAGTPESLR